MVRLDSTNPTEMATRSQLMAHAAALSDEELIERLRSGILTETAQEITREELAARGVDVARAVASRPPAEPQPDGLTQARGVLAPMLRRVTRFPLRAFLGLEPLWAVIVFGGAAVYLVFRSIVYLIGGLGADLPAPAYAMPASYALLLVHALALAWLAVSLWRTGGRSRSLIWNLAARSLALLCAFAILGTSGAVRVTQEYLSPAPKSVMDVAPQR